MESPDAVKKGKEGEIIAVGYLEKLGYDVIARNWKHGRYELDLIAETAKDIVFIEVKTRYSNRYGEPWEAVNKGKRKKICCSADAFLRDYPGNKEPRFDIISIIRTGEKYEVLHIEDAFYPVL